MIEEPCLEMVGWAKAHFERVKGSKWHFLGDAMRWYLPKAPKKIMLARTPTLATKAPKKKRVPRNRDTRYTYCFTKKI
jgi:hypothetical protein